MASFKSLKKLAEETAKKGSGGVPGGKKGMGGLGLALGGSALFYGLSNSLFTVEAGHRAVMFNRFGGVSKTVYAEGTHVCIPWFQQPTTYDVRTKAQPFRSPTGTRDLQMVDITLRVLYKPSADHLPEIYSKLGTNYDERVLPSIVNETLKSVIAQFNASQLITQRETVSKLIAAHLIERSKDFYIMVDDVSITHLTFGQEYTAAVEAKQVAQQEAERAKFLVLQAQQDKKSTIINAEGEAESVRMIGKAMAKNPGYIQLRQLDAAKQIAVAVAEGNNRLFLDSEQLMLNSSDSGSSMKNRMANA